MSLKKYVAAAHEVRKGRQFVYEGYNDCVCLVECDAEPPHDVNQDALQASLQIAKLLNAKIVDEIQLRCFLEIGNRENILECRLQPDIFPFFRQQVHLQEIRIGLPLDSQKVGHGKGTFNLRKI